MNLELKNDKLTVGLKTAGAEMTAVTSKDGVNYLWNGNPEYWNRHAPVLFPIVGKVNNNKYTANKNGDTATFELSQHGFARDSEFEVVESSNNKAVFLLASNEKTKEKYPYDFNLKLTYELNDTAVKVIYTVENTDNEDIFFAIGGHPAFNCPLVDGEEFSDYYIEFEKEENVKKLLITEDVRLTGKEVDYVTKEMPLSHEFFANGVTILKGLTSEYIALKSHKNPYSVVVNCKDMPFVGIWSKESGAPFVCIEPWYGHTDIDGQDSNLANKKDFVRLAKGESFSCDYTLNFK